MHNRNNYRVNSKDISLRIVFHSHLGFPVRTKHRMDSDLLGQPAAEGSRQGNGQGHTLFCLRTCAAKHHTLIPGPADFITGSQCNIGRLCVDPALDLNGVRIKSLAGMDITDAADDMSGNRRIIHHCFCSNLSADHAEVCCNHCFACHSGRRILTKALIQDRIGNGIRHLVRMTGGDTLGSKKSAVH